MTFSLPLHLSVSVSLQELSRVHAHEVLSVSWWEVHPGREQSSVLTPSLKSFITTPRTNCPSAEPNTCLCCSRCWYRRSETTHTHTRLSRTPDTLRASLRRLLQCFIFNHISQALREFDLCLEWELDFSGVWSDSSLVWMKTQSACTDTVLMCYTRVKNIFHTTGL